MGETHDTNGKKNNLANGKSTVLAQGPVVADPTEEVENDKNLDEYGASFDPSSIAHDVDNNVPSNIANDVPSNIANDVPSNIANDVDHPVNAACKEVCNVVLEGGVKKTVCHTQCPGGLVQDSVPDDPTEEEENDKNLDEYGINLPGPASDIAH